MLPLKYRHKKQQQSSASKTCIFPFTVQWGSALHLFTNYKHVHTRTSCCGPSVSTSLSIILEWWNCPRNSRTGIREGSLPHDRYPRHRQRPRGTDEVNTFSTFTHLVCVSCLALLHVPPGVWRLSRLRFTRVRRGVVHYLMMLSWFQNLQNATYIGDLDKPCPSLTNTLLPS